MIIKRGFYASNKPIVLSRIRAGICLLVALPGCAFRGLILSAPSISATAIPGNMKGTMARADMKEVEGIYCVGDKPQLSKDNNVGLIDEAVYDAQLKSRSKYLKNVSIYLEKKSFSPQCVVVRGVPFN